MTARPRDDVPTGSTTAPNEAGISAVVALADDAGVPGMLATVSAALARIIDRAPKPETSVAACELYRLRKWRALVEAAAYDALENYERT